MSKGTRPGKKKDSLPAATPQNPQSEPPTSPLQAAMQGISLLCNTGLSNTELKLCIDLLMAEVHPQALADIVRPLLAARKKPDNFDDDIPQQQIQNRFYH